MHRSAITTSLLLLSLACFIACGGGGGSPSSSTSPVSTTETESRDNSTTPAAPTPPPQVGSELYARVHAKELAKKFIDEKVRHTVKFPTFSQSDPVYLPPDRSLPGRSEPQWDVRGVLRVTNVFGAEIEHDFYVRLRVQEDGEEDLYAPIFVELGGEAKYVDEAYYHTMMAEKEVLDQQRAQAEAAARAEEKAEQKRRADEQRRTENTRTWKDASGGYSVEATFIKSAGGKVTLEKADGSTVVIDLERLSEEDQKWLRNKFKR